MKWSPRRNFDWTPFIGSRVYVHNPKFPENAEGYGVIESFDICSVNVKIDSDGETLSCPHDWIEVIDQ